MNQKQIETEAKIRKLARVFNEITPDKLVDENWACSVADPESSMGINQKSPTGALGVYQMTGIAMKDLLWEMEKVDDDLIDIVCGLLFLRLLKHRHGTFEKATFHYCDPDDRAFYVPKVMKLLKEYKQKGEHHEHELRKTQECKNPVSDPVDPGPVVDDDELQDVHPATPNGEDNIHTPGARGHDLRAKRRARDPRV